MPISATDDDASNGFFVVEANHLIGVTPSIEGPILIVDSNSFPFLTRNINIEMGNEKEGELNPFKIKVDHQDILSIQYRRPYSNGGFGDYTGPETVDFFYWLTYGYKTQDFKKFLTLGDRNFVFTGADVTTLNEHLST